MYMKDADVGDTPAIFLDPTGHIKVIQVAEIKY
jgi:hypothetical protein